MVTLLALSAAVGYGVADFLGGAASRRATVLRVLVIAAPSGLAVLVTWSALVGGTPTPASLAWGFASGAAGGAGQIAFYRALAKGPMSVVAPVSALAAAVLPVVIGVLSGERLDPLVLIGVVLCVVAIGLVCMEEDKEDKPPRTALLHRNGTSSRSTLLRRNGVASRIRALVDNGPFMAALSGMTFGMFFILIRQAGRDSGLWPTAASRMGNLCVIVASALVLYAWRRRQGSDTFKGRLGQWGLALAIISGVLDASANAAYFVAARDGMLSLAAVLTSLYPAITVLMARLFYAERLRTVQRIGLAVAAAGVALVTAG